MMIASGAATGRAQPPPALGCAQAPRSSDDASAGDARRANASAGDDQRGHPRPGAPRGHESANLLNGVLADRTRYNEEPRGGAVIGSVAKRDSEFTVAPQGGAFEVHMHAGSICVLSFPGEDVEGSVLTSSTEVDVKPWGERPYRHRDRVAVLASSKVTTATVALATRSGRIKVNLTITVVPPSEAALTFVTFKAATTEELLQAQLELEVAKRVAPLAGELEELKRRMDQHLERAARAASPRPPSGSCRK
jgi:hypothetical protein